MLDALRPTLTAHRTPTEEPDRCSRRCLTCAAAAAAALALAAAARSRSRRRPARAGLHADRRSTARTVALADFKRQVRRARVDQPALPVRAEALQQRQHAVAAEALHRRRRAVWLAINSTDADARASTWRRPSWQAWMQKQGAATDRRCSTPTARSAAPTAPRTTPHMYVIDPKGTLVYAGAIDDKRTRQPGRREDREQLRRAGARRTAAPASRSSAAARSAYGCTIKY
ncbi:MAG: hypothetical protein MZW92_77760 [Comamonadaceae bacterium]|nr:hypothetical protein [Comamonadaceae bacterium]